MSWQDTIDLDLDSSFMDDIDYGNIAEEADSASENEEQPVISTPTPVAQKAGINFGMIALGGLALLLIASKR